MVFGKKKQQKCEISTGRVMRRLLGVFGEVGRREGCGWVVAGGWW